MVSDNCSRHVSPQYVVPRTGSERARASLPPSPRARGSGLDGSNLISGDGGNPGANG